MRKYSNDFGFKVIAENEITEMIARIDARREKVSRMWEIIDTVAAERKISDDALWKEISSASGSERSGRLDTVANQALANIIRKVESSTFLKELRALDYIENDLKPAVESAASLGTESEDGMRAWAYVGKMISDDIYDEIAEFPEDIRTEAFKILTCVALIAEFRILNNLTQSHT